MSVAADRWANLPGPTKVLAAARDLLENGKTGLNVTVRVTLDAAERDQVGRILGMAWEASAAPVTLGRLRKALRGLDDSLEDLLVRLGGPLDDRVAKRESDRQAAKDHIDSAYAVLTGAGIPEHAVALARIRRWLEHTSPDLADSRAQALALLWQHLPAASRPLPELANSLFGNPHHLDRDADLGRLAARLLAAADATDPGAAAVAAGAALSADTWRQVWARVGVSCDEVSATVLVLNLPLIGSGAAAAITAAAAETGEPVWLTARSLRRGWKPESGLNTVRVCENPVVVETAAVRLGPHALPLICVYGRPSSAAWLLLEGLAAAGVRLLITCDRDTAGQQFLTELLRLPGAVEWLAEADGVYEESRLTDLLTDLTPTSLSGS
ncbi:TIGR02679 domain-containing protein [Micromonospora sp. WMMA1976]|uniref:TIGR02679 domain-containing protein n=1 Tax=Micromonospora sp. WMMA1976 TaxID=3014995 RepID=UPI00248BF133|nr:TIGR02679 domain-containing protein [Micromonospora sp. WMMA1976]WBC05312.1 TIGR02679 domain-containing protein [Micromonospora sp. WMMA1976]